MNQRPRRQVRTSELDPLLSRTRDSDFDAGVEAIIEEFKSKGVKSLIQTDGIYAMCELDTKGNLKGTSVRALICKMSENKGVAPISLDKKHGWLVFIPEEE